MAVEQPGVIVRRLRINAGLSPRGLAVAIKVSHPAIYALEKGDGEPQAATKKKIADYFELKVTDIWPVPEEAVING